MFTFRLEEHGSTLHIPLDELLLPPDLDGRREFCVRSTHRTAKDASCPLSCPADQPILIGAMALQRFFAVFEMLPERCVRGWAGGGGW